MDRKSSIRCKQGQCRLHVFCHITPETSQIASIYLSEKPLAMQTLRGSYQFGVGRFMHLDTL